VCVQIFLKFYVKDTLMANKFNNTKFNSKVAFIFIHVRIYRCKSDLREQSLLTKDQIKRTFMYFAMSETMDKA